MVHSEAQGHGKLKGTVRCCAQGGFVWREHCYIIDIYKEACGWELPGRAVLKGTRFFFFCQGPPLRTAPRDHQPPTADSHQPPTATNRQPPTASHQPPPTASGDQPPTADHCQPPPTTNHQPPTAANHHQPPPTASCQLPTANRHQPWLSTWSARGPFWENWFRNTFFFPVKDRPAPWSGWRETLHKPG